MLLCLGAPSSAARGLVFGFLCATGLGPIAGAQSHTHGSMVGTLKPDSVIVWTRASGSALVSVRYGTSPTLVGASETSQALATSSSDYTSKTTLTGLQPNTRYYYATVLANPQTPTQKTAGAIGRFKTAPAATQDSPVTFLFSADVGVDSMSEYTTFDWMRTHSNAEFYISMGDMPYADGAVSKDDFRAKHKAVRNSSKWFEFIKAFPVEATVDDHEVVNNWDATTSSTLVANGVAVFKEYYPFPKNAPVIYRSIPWGKALEIFILDTRSYRGVNGSPTVPSKTLLGTTQKQWLLQALKSSAATFKIVVTSMPLRHCDPEDTWVGYGRERREIFAYLNQQKIRNVLFLTGDNHMAGVHHHREGVREYMVGPVARPLGTGLPAQEGMRWRSRERSYGLIQIDPTQTPATLTLEIFGEGGMRKRETIRAEASAKIRLVSDDPAGGFRMTGPRFYRNRGQRVGLPSIEPGTYRVSFDPIEQLADLPTEIDLTIPAGSAVDIAANWHDVQTRKILLADDFEKPLGGYTVIDETTTAGPSAWYTDGGFLVQASNIGGAGAPSLPGTILWTGDRTWQDYTLSTRAWSKDDDVWGILFRYVDKDNYYRFTVDKQRANRMLVKKVNGTTTVLSQDNITFDPRWYDFKAVAIGDRIQIYFGRDKIFDVRDTSHPAGAVGLFTWGNLITHFDDLVVTEGDSSGATPGGALLRDEFNDSQFSGWAVQDQGSASAPSGWQETRRVLRQRSNIGDPLTTANRIAKPGTTATLRTKSFTDFEYSVDIMSFDIDAYGVVFRYKDAGNHYRFELDQRNKERRLVKVASGQWTVLHEDNGSYTQAQWYKVRCTAVGNRLAIHINDELWAEVADSAHSSGYVGLWTFQNHDAIFDGLLVRSVPKPRPVFTAVTKGLKSDLYGKAPQSKLEPYVLALSFGRSPGVPISLVIPSDQRMLDLTFDFLLKESLRPSPIWTNFQDKLNTEGELTARINWPNLAALKGTTMYCGGWTGDITKSQILELIPTVEIVYP